MLVLHLPLVVEAVVLPCLWPQPEAWGCPCAGVTACVSLEEGLHIRSCPLAAVPGWLCWHWTCWARGAGVGGHGHTQTALSSSLCPLLPFPALLFYRLTCVMKVISHCVGSVGYVQEKQVITQDQSLPLLLALECYSQHLLEPWKLQLVVSHCLLTVALPYLIFLF